jgi:PAS domain S-box-containing protein
MALMEQASEDQSRQDLMRGEAKFKTIANAIPQMVWSTLPDGSHDYYNDQWYDYTGIEAGKMHDEEWDRLLHPDDQVRAWNRWCTSLDTGAPYEIEYRLRHKSGQYRWVLSRALPMRDEHGAIARWMGTCTDIHEQKLAQEHLQQADRARTNSWPCWRTNCATRWRRSAPRRCCWRWKRCRRRAYGRSAKSSTRQVRHMTAWSTI